MPLSLHREMYTRSGASRMHPTGPVRAVHTKPQTLGWLEVSVSEFVQLLARHEAGEINLLAMPEMLVMRWKQTNRRKWNSHRRSSPSRGVATSKVTPT